MAQTLTMTAACPPRRACRHRAEALLEPLRGRRAARPGAACDLRRHGARAWARPPASPRWRPGSRGSSRPSTRPPTPCTRNTSTTARRSRRGRCSCCAGAFVGALVSGMQGQRVRWIRRARPAPVRWPSRSRWPSSGGFIAAYGAKIAKGCTSGQALTGGSILNVGSLVFMLAVFAAAYGLAYFVRKEWL